MSYNYDTYPCGHSKYGYLVKRNQGGASLLSRRVYGNKFFADSLEDVLNDNRIRYYELKQVIKSGDDLYLVNLFDLGDDLASIRKSLQSLLLCRINVILITPDNNELELSRCRREIMYILDLAASFISQQNQQSKCGAVNCVPCGGATLILKRVRSLSITTLSIVIMTVRFPLR